MTKNRFLTSACFVVGCAFLLGGCSGGESLNERLGFGRITPDEFAVVDQPPLTIPPNFDLRPPRPGAQPTNQSTAEETARRALYPATAMTLPSASAQQDKLDPSPSSLEQSLLIQSKATENTPNIREVIDREEDDTVTGSRHLIEEMMLWKTANLPPATTLDSQGESQRLRDSKEEGTPATQTPTPVIRKREKGLIGN